MTEVRQGPTPRVRFREVSVKRELSVFSLITAFYLIYIVVFLPQDFFFFSISETSCGENTSNDTETSGCPKYSVCAR